VESERVVVVAFADDETRKVRKFLLLSDHVPLSFTPFSAPTPAKLISLK